MSNGSKLILSDEELQLVNDSAWILTKRVIIDKVYQLFGNLSEHIKRSLEISELPAEVKGSSAKISKGENYLQLPYVMLDHPRCFDTSDVFAIRTMFWWGNFFSITLQLSGKYKAMFAERICISREALMQHGYFICINEDQWQHHFKEDNYREVKQLSGQEFEKIIREKEFIKLAVKFPLQEWKGLFESLEDSVDDIMKLLKDQLPMR
jgi:hypothetical protein